MNPEREAQIKIDCINQQMPFVLASINRFFFIRHHGSLKGKE